jgi:hypothetical protein
MSAPAIDLKRSRSWDFDAEYRAKRRLERRIWKHFARLHRQEVSAFTTTLATTGRLPDLEYRFGTEAQRLLGSHYRETGRIFGGRLSGRLPEDLQARDWEVREIRRRTAAIFAQRAAQQAEKISATTAKNALQALEAVRREAMEAAEVLTDRETALRAGAVLARRLNGRLSAITSFETQAPAEAAKRIEFEVLSGGHDVEMVKRWWSSGDHRAREWHLMADQQERPVRQAFEVNGEKLMQPGDTTLGASLSNVINCRCSTEYDERVIEDIRRERGL